MNNLVAELRAWRNLWHKPNPEYALLTAVADEIERLTAEAGMWQRRSANYAAIEHERDRLTAQLMEFEAERDAARQAAWHHTIEINRLRAELAKAKKLLEHAIAIGGGLRAALRDLLEDTQHVNHNCGGDDECPVVRAHKALAGGEK